MKVWVRGLASGRNGRCDTPLRPWGGFNRRRLASDWASGAMRFDRPGEALLAAYSEGVLAAIGGITIDPIVPDALRMRRFYVRPAFRRTGIGGEIAQCDGV